MKDCIFCKIVAREIPCIKVYEDNNILAFLDIRPLNLGHTLVIPKKHHRWVWDIQNLGKFYEIVKKIANAIRKALKTEFLVSLVVGEEVHHAHVWLVPRFKNDGHGASIDLSNKKEISKKDMQEIAKKIKAAVV